MSFIGLIFLTQKIQEEAENLGIEGHLHLQSQ